jgi:hypothetical protein
MKARMTVLAATAVFLCLTVAAGANLTPDSRPSDIQDNDPVAARNDTDINSGTSGALLERGYFQAPQPQLNVSCRLQLSVFDKTRLTEACN